MDREKKITVIKDGPYLVNGSVPLAAELIVYGPDDIPACWETGKRYPLQDSYSLCRCGSSDDKPYCDGKHADTGFKDEDQAPDEAFFEIADVIEGPGINLFDVPPLCALAGFCHRGGNIWKLAATGSDQQSIGVVIDDACDCPAGRLVAADRSSREPIERELEPSISVVEMPVKNRSGPLWFKGGIPIESIDGWTYEVRNRVTLCRCGESKNMPFCDASHTSIDFNSGGRPGR
jgi:CDGSH-type Zn-finger protein